MNLLAIVALCGALLGGGFSWLVSGWINSVQIAAIKTEQAKDAAIASQLSLDRLSATQAKADALSAQLAKTEFQLNQTTLEKSDAIKKITPGRACLNSATVGLLNRARETTTTAVPEPPGTLAAESTDIATDTDVAGWIVATQGTYETCRARLNTLIDFEATQDDRK
ncbi:MAG: hypothetical protein Q8N35_13165 [Methylococcaceae bacterium]|nr:hypothetical protein [Methylococcaceae bacterium]MDP2395028.1 hypothetical protein [Methylococcaceae bacterium]MDP3020528.1 hypothetical protein [Methylococcaceae bacterium]MDP3389720.1 hypothetical protein [Methylococcaceae bacterium]MDP3932516.1 hypothetical protein [Methylococcaceae bacterium]